MGCIYCKVSDVPDAVHSIGCPSATGKIVAQGVMQVMATKWMLSMLTLYEWDTGGDIIISVETTHLAPREVLLVDNFINEAATFGEGVRAVLFS